MKKQIEVAYASNASTPDPSASASRTLVDRDAGAGPQASCMVGKHCHHPTPGQCSVFTPPQEGPCFPSKATENCVGLG